MDRLIVFVGRMCSPSDSMNVKKMVVSYLDQFKSFLSKQPKRFFCDSN